MLVLPIRHSHPTQCSLEQRARGRSRRVWKCSWRGKEFGWDCHVTSQQVSLPPLAPAGGPLAGVLLYHLTYPTYFHVHSQPTASIPHRKGHRCLQPCSPFVSCFMLPPYPGVFFFLGLNDTLIRFALHIRCSLGHASLVASPPNDTHCNRH